CCGEVAPDLREAGIHRAERADQLIELRLQRPVVGATRTVDRGTRLVRERDDLVASRAHARIRFAELGDRRIDACLQRLLALDRLVYLCSHEFERSLECWVRGRRSLSE